MTFAEQLLAAADDLTLSREELRAWLQRAAIRVRDIEAVEGAEAEVHAAMLDLDEDTETKGSA